MRLTRFAGLAAAMVVTAGLGVSAASALVGSRDPVVAQSPVPVPGSARVDQTAPDPGGGPDWAVRIYDGVSGGACAELGRADAGRFGRIGPGGTFSALGLDEGGTCGDLVAEPALLAINDYPDGPGRAAATVLFGRVSRDVARVTVLPGTELVAGPGGGFVVARAGNLSPTALAARITLASGRQVIYDWR